MNACSHPATELVRNTVTGEVYAELCTRCLAELPVGWNCPDCDVEAVVAEFSALPIRHVVADPCEAHR